MLEEWTISQLTGPIGGKIALAYIAGAISGWGFTNKIMKSRITFLQEEIKRVEERYRSQVKYLKERAEAMEQRIRMIEDTRYWALASQVKKQD